MNERRFSGGDTLVPGTMEYGAYQIMMNSELRQGKGAYEIANAVAAQSGPSFGPFQYDLGANQDGRDLLESIAVAAKDPQGRPIISATDLADIKSHLYKPFNEYTPADQAVYDRMKPRLDAALASPAGVAAIDADFVPRVQAKVTAMNAVVQSLPDGPNKSFVEGSPVARLMIIDTKNQYGGAVNDGLKDFLGHSKDDPAMQMPGRPQGKTIAVDGDFGLDDMIRYKLETQYGQTDKGARDVLRRISHCIEAAGVDTVKASLSEEDRQFLDKGLATYLEKHGRDASMLDDPQLKALAEVAGREQHGAAPAHGHGGASPLLKAGSEGASVAALQRNLTGLGYVDAAGQSMAVSGSFDEATRMGVEDFQRAAGLASVDGKAGPKTLEQLNHEVTALQSDLAGLGYKQNGHSLRADGDFGPATKQAVESFQREHDLPMTGVADAATAACIRAAVQADALPVQALRLDDRDHPGNALFESARDHVQRLDQSIGRTSDHLSDNLSGAVAMQAHADGLKRIDGVALSEDGSRLWAIERPVGREDALFDRTTSVPTSAVNVSLEQSSSQWPQAQEKFEQTQRQAAVVQTPAAQETRAPTQ